VNNADLVQLAPLTELTELDVRGWTYITDAGRDNFRRLQAIEKQKRSAEAPVMSSLFLEGSSDQKGS
jgi:hypothetical protein